MLRAGSSEGHGVVCNNCDDTTNFLPIKPKIIKSSLNTSDRDEARITLGC